MEPISLLEFMDAAERAIQGRLTLSWLEAFRGRLDLCRTEAKQERKLRKSEIEGLFLRLMAMDILFTERSFEVATGDPEDRRLYSLLVAHYVFQREESAKNAKKHGWRCPPIGGIGQKEFDESCLFHLMYPIRTRRGR